jgi:hypothetical protein
VPEQLCPSITTSVFVLFQAYNEFCSVTDTEGISSTDEGSGYLYLVPGKPKRHRFTFIPLKEDVGKQIQV